MKTIIFLASHFLMLLFATRSDAGMIVEFTGSPEISYQDPNKWICSSFTTGPLRIDLDRVTVWMGKDVSTPPMEGPFFDVCLFGDKSGKPDVDNRIYGATYSRYLTPVLNAVALTYSDPIRLEPNTRYWLAIGNPTLYVKYIVGVDASGGVGNYSHVEGVNIEAGSLTAEGQHVPYQYWARSDGSTLAYDLAGTATVIVPEPQAWAILSALALSALALWEMAEGAVRMKGFGRNFAVGNG